MFYIRVDADNHIGFGHLSRMLTVADELKHLIKENNGPLFFVRGEAAAEIIQDRGFSVQTLPEEADAPFSTAEAEKIKELLKKESGRHTLLIDSYLVTNDYLDALKDTSFRIVMDDEMKAVFSADMIVNYNFYADEAAYHLLYQKAGFPAGQLPVFVTGSAYMPVRSSFFANPVCRKENVKSILITAGGSDEYGLAGKLLERLSDPENQSAFSNTAFHIVCGAFDQNYDTYVRKYATNPHLTFHQNVKDMAALMKDCDLAVSAGGSTLNELCAVGLPTVCFSYAENQTRPCEALQKRDAVIFAGMIGDPDAPAKNIPVLRKIIDTLKELSVSYTRREELSRNAKDAVPKGGAYRLAERIYSVSRPAR